MALSVEPSSHIGLRARIRYMSGTGGWHCRDGVQRLGSMKGLEHMKAARATNRAAERGTAAVEFALIVPLLVMLLLGIVTVGITYSRANGLSNAVREGSRFGATADASSLVAGQWAADTIGQVRATQFDDPATETTVCVQLWKIGSGPIASTGSCDRPSGAPALAVPSTATDNPRVPSGPAGSCVVRIVAAREFTIDIGLAS
jgi:Flp pilus assembly pilin Flp